MGWMKGFDELIGDFQRWIGMLDWRAFERVPTSERPNGHGEVRGPSKT